MPNVTVRLEVEVDGQPVPGFPVIKRLLLDESAAFEFGKPDDGGWTFSALPADLLDVISVLMLRTDRQITLRLDGQSDAGIVLNAGGVLALVDVTIDAGAGVLNAKLNNQSGATAVVSGLAAGS